MGRRRYMTKRRIEEKISKQRKASFFMVFAVMITAITLTYKNVDGDFSRLMGSTIYYCESSWTLQGNLCLKKVDGQAGNAIGKCKKYNSAAIYEDDNCYLRESFKNLCENYNSGKFYWSDYQGKCISRAKFSSKSYSKSQLCPKPNKVHGNECYSYVGKPSEYFCFNSDNVLVGKYCYISKQALRKNNNYNNQKNDYIYETECIKAGGIWKNNNCTKTNNNAKDDNDNNSNDSDNENIYTPNNSGSGDNYNLNNDSLDEKKESANGTIVSPKLTINSNKVVLYVNKTYKLKVTSNVKNDKITYSSSDKNIVIVGSKGLIKGKKEGQAKITATSSSGKKVETNIIVGKKFDIGVNYGPSSKVAVNKSNKVTLNVTDTKLTNVWVFDDKLNGNSIFEKEYEKVKTSGDIEIKNLPEKGKTKRYYVRTRDSAKLYSYTTFVVKNNNGKYNKSTGPTIKNVRGIQIGDEKYIAYTVSSSHGLYSIKEGQKNGKLNKNYIPSGAQEYSNIVKLSDLTKSKGNYYYLWIHALDAATYKNYTRVNAQIKLK